jgi:hypothetical protein
VIRNGWDTKDKMRAKTKRLVITYALPLLILYILALCLIPFFRDHDVTLKTAIHTGLLSIFGPWSTQVSKLTTIPHAGELCYPWLTRVALGLSAGLIAVISISILSSKKWITACCVALYFPQILVWMYFGLMLMASYLT